MRPFRTTFFTCLVAALIALTQASPMNLTSTFSRSIPVDLRLAEPSNVTVESLGSEISKRNPPGWEDVTGANANLIDRYERKGRTKNSPMFYLKFQGACPNGPDSRPTMGGINFYDHMKGFLHDDPLNSNWQRKTFDHKRFIREWTRTEVSDESRKFLVPIMPILNILRWAT